VPIAGFLALSVLASLGRPSFGLVEAKPVWLTSTLVRDLGSTPGLLLLVGFYALNLSWAFRRLWRDHA
jgi:hypothetical protein